MCPGPSSRTSTGNIVATFVVLPFVDIMFLYYDNPFNGQHVFILTLVHQWDQLMSTYYSTYWWVPCLLSLSPPLLRLDARANTKSARAVWPLTESGRFHQLRHQFHVILVLVLYVTSLGTIVTVTDKLGQQYLLAIKCVDK